MHAQERGALIEAAAPRKCGTDVELAEAAVEVRTAHAHLAVARDDSLPGPSAITPFHGPIHTLSIETEPSTTPSLNNSTGSSSPRCANAYSRGR